MADFDLSQALDTCCIGQPQCSYSVSAGDTEDATFPFGLQLIISCNTKTMRHVANLVVAVNKLKKPQIKLRPGLSEERLCSAVFESLIKETTVESSEGRRPPREGLQLCAITLKGGNSEQKVKFQMCRYRNNVPEVSTPKGQPVILTITDSNLHLTCSMQGEKAVLNLEECSESDLQNISTERNTVRFLFYKTIEGRSMTKFESVNCKGWFISTSSEDENQPVEMCRVDNAGRLTCFNISRSNK
ncbi:hypothetical protein WMY93_020790 [Mugilogobius chulae]|uniref:Interleukin-1 n=1 Tax=Mugilogobius chulae TaxID=88201 RepID=A0AAW0NC21_9GOBI